MVHLYSNFRIGLKKMNVLFFRCADILEAFTPISLNFNGNKILSITANAVDSFAHTKTLQDFCCAKCQDKKINALIT